jgi:hypothetical protein
LARQEALPREAHGQGHPPLGDPEEHPERLFLVKRPTEAMEAANAKVNHVLGAI